MSRFTFSESKRAEHRQDTRSKLGIPENALVIVFSGKFQDHKRPLDLIDACAALPSDTRETVHALFIGDGPLKTGMKQRALGLGLVNQVHITGFVNQSDMPRYLAAGDVLAVTSERDAHPLTVTEALPFGMAIIASDKVGCVGPTDTARPGKNTLTYACADIAALSEGIHSLAVDPGARRAMGQISREIAPSQDISAAADAVQAAWTKLEQ